MINTLSYRSIFMKRQNKHLRTSRTYRFSPSLAHSISRTAQSLNLSESEFVRMALADTIDRIS